MCYYSRECYNQTTVSIFHYSIFANFGQKYSKTILIRKKK